MGALSSDIHVLQPCLYPFVKAVFVCLFYFWLLWVFVSAYGFSLVVARGGYSLVAVQGLSIVVDSLVVHRLWAYRL